MAVKNEEGILKIHNGFLVRKRAAMSVNSVVNLYDIIAKCHLTHTSVLC